MKRFHSQKLLAKLGNLLLALCLLALNSGPVHAADALTTQENDTTAARPSATVINNRILIDFSPYMDGQNPNSGTVLSEAQIRQRMQIIAPYSKWIRSFSCGNGLEVIGRIAHEMNLQVAVNAWIGPSDTVNQQQISCLIGQANAGYVDLAIVGSEALLRGDVTPDALIGYIDQVRQAIPSSIPVTTADVYGMFLDNPLLVDHIDLIFANIYPFWEGYKVQYGVAILNYYYNQLAARYPAKTIEISETGWPSCGSHGEAVGSPANETLYFSQVESWAHDKNITLFYFDGLDESWKVQYEGPQGGCWGIWDKNGVMKEGMSAVFEGQFVDYSLALPSTCDTDQFSFDFTYVPPYESYDYVQGKTCGIFHKDYQIMLYIKVNGGWWVKPTFADPTTSISSNGTWSVDYTTGGIDQLASEIRAYLVPTNEVGSCSPISDTCGYPMISAARSNEVFIGTTKQGGYYIPEHESSRQSYGNVNQGPVKIQNTDGNNIVASQRVIYSGWSYSEMMGLPFEQLSKEYLFPYYNNVAMDSQLRVSNVGGADTTITVYLGTTQIDSYTLATGGATRKNYSGRNSGPLRVTSTASNILATIRVLYGGSSYSELMGLPVGQLTKEYLFPYYNNVAMDSQLRVSNVGGASTTINVYLGSSITPIDSYTLAAGGATRKNYTGKNSGPLRVTSSASNILTTIRVLYNKNSYSELMGFPTGQLGQEYWYPVYDNVAVDSQLRVSNVGADVTTITIYAGTEQIDSYTLGKGAATRKNYPKNIGPLHVFSSSQPILTTIRTLYAGSSYYEMTGLPDSQLSTQYFFPWYNNSAMSSELRFALP